LDVGICSQEDFTIVGGLPKTLQCGALCGGGGQQLSDGAMEVICQKKTGKGTWTQNRKSQKLQAVRKSKSWFGTLQRPHRYGVFLRGNIIIFRFYGNGLVMPGGGKDITIHRNMQN